VERKPTLARTFQAARRRHGRRRWRFRRWAREWSLASGVWWFCQRRGSEETVDLPGWQVKLTLSTARISTAFLVLGNAWTNHELQSLMDPWMEFIRQGTERSQCTTRVEGKCAAEDGRFDSAFVKMGHCLASNLSGVARNILLHWMQTRWMTGTDDGAGLGRFVQTTEGEWPFCPGCSRQT